MWGGQDKPRIVGVSDSAKEIWRLYLSEFNEEGCLHYIGSRAFIQIGNDGARVQSSSGKTGVDYIQVVKDYLTKLVEGGQVAEAQEAGTSPEKV